MNDPAQILTQVMEKLGGMDARLENIERAVSGNGQPGLSQKVEELEASNNRIKGAGILGTFLLGIAEYFYHKH